MKTSRKGLPYVSILFCALFCCLSFMGINAGSGKVFGWFANMTAVAGLMTWFGIAVTYIRFYKGFKAQGFDRSALPYASVLQPYAAWYAAISCLVICFVSSLFLGSILFLTIQFSPITVQRLAGLLERSMGSSHFRHQLFAFHPLPHIIHCVEVEDPGAYREADGHGFQDWSR